MGARSGGQFSSDAVRDQPLNMCWLNSNDSPVADKKVIYDDSFLSASVFFPSLFFCCCWVGLLLWRSASFWVARCVLGKT